MAESFKSKIGFQILYTLISPALAFYNLFKVKNERIIVAGGTILMGIAGSIYDFAPGTDGASHLERVRTGYLNMGANEFFVESFNILTLSPTGSSTDIYIHFLSFIAGSVFSTPQLLHFLSGLVLGYFFTKSVLLIFRKRSLRKLPWWIIGFVVYFLTVRSFTALNSIRMWTAMWVLFYGGYRFVITKNNKYILLGLGSALIHFSYLIFIIPVIAGFVLRKRKVILLLIFILSFFSKINYDLFSRYIPETSLATQKEKAYVRLDTEEGGIEAGTQNTNFYKKYGPTIYKNYSLVALGGILLISMFKVQFNDEVLFLISAGVLLYSFGNIIDFSGSISGRAKGISSTFLTGANLCVLLTLNKYKLNKYYYIFFKNMMILILITTVPFFLFHLSYTFNLLSTFFLFIPFISWIIGEGDLSIRDFLAFLIGR